MDTTPPPPFFRTYGLFCTVFLLCAVATLVPFFRVQFLPLVDWPQHLSAVAVLAHLHDAPWNFEPYVAHDPQLTYVVFYYLAALLAKALPVDLAARVVFATTLVGTPASVAFFLHSSRRSPWPSLLAFALAFSWPFYFGFVSYLFAVPLVFVSLGLLERLARAPSSRAAAALACSTLLLFASHSLCFLVYLPMAAVSVLVRPRPLLPRLWRTALATLPALALFTAYTLSNFITPGTHLGRSQFVPRQGPFAWNLPMLNTRLHAWAIWFGEGFNDNTDEQLAHAWVAVLVALTLLGVAFALGRLSKGARRPAFTEWLRPFLMALVPLLCFALLPEELAGVWAIAQRMLVVAACAAPFIIPVPAARQWLLALLFVPAALTALRGAWLNNTHFLLYQRETQGLHEVLDALPWGQRVTTLVYNVTSTVMSNSAHVHTGAYSMAERGGVSGFTFFHVRTHPVRFAHLAPTPFPGNTTEWRPDLWSYPLLGPVTDYVILRNRTTVDPSSEVPEGALVPVLQRGAWALLRNTRARPGAGLYALRENLRRVQVLSEPASAVHCGPLVDDRIACGATSIAPVESEGFVGRLPCLTVPVPQSGRIGLRFRDIPPGAASLRGLLEAHFERREYGAAMQLSVEGPGGLHVIDTALNVYHPGVSLDTPLPAALRNGAPLTLWFSAQHSRAPSVCLALTLYDR